MEGYKLGIQKVCIFFKKASKVINEGGGAYWFEIKMSIASI